MPHADPVNWQPISEMPLIASMIDVALDDTRDHIETLTKARTRPHLLDDATIDRVERVHNEQRLEEQNRQLRAVTVNVLSLAHELRQGTIDRIAETSDAELGLQALLGNSPITRR